MWDYKGHLLKSPHLPIVISCFVCVFMCTFHMLKNRNCWKLLLFLWKKMYFALFTDSLKHLIWGGVWLSI